MKLSFKKTAVALVAGVGLLAGSAGVASADGAGGQAGTGWDGVNQILLGQGSDTTYLMMQGVTNVYNAAPGCETDNASGSATLGQCILPPGQSRTDVKGNWDHDVTTEMFPTGSGAGIKALQLSQVDFARSSRGPKTSGESDLNFFAYAKDGLAMITMAGRSAANLTKSQIQGIYNCTITDWSTLGFPAGTIAPYGMNTSSGTYASMVTFLGFDPNAGACVKKLGNGDLPFENDVKQIAGPGALAADVANAPNAFWWGSYAELKTYAYKAQTAEFWSVDGVAISNGTIANNSYGAKRFVYHVAKKVDATPTLAGTGTGTGDMGGTVSGKGGGVREFTEFICKPKVDHTTSLNTGNSNYDDLTSVIVNSGFQRTPSAERTNGACRVEAGP